MRRVVDKLLSLYKDMKIRVEYFMVNHDPIYDHSEVFVGQIPVLVTRIYHDDVEIEFIGCTYENHIWKIRYMIKHIGTVSTNNERAELKINGQLFIRKVNRHIYETLYLRMKRFTKGTPRLHVDCVGWETIPELQ